VGLILLGVVMVANGERMPGDANPLDDNAHPGKKNLGVGWALLSGTAFGVMFWLLGIRIVPMLGSAPTVWVIRLTSFLLTAIVILILRRPIALPGMATSRWILGVGILDTSAYIFNNYGMQHEQVSVVSVLASLYGAVTVALAATILGEKVSRLQWLGVASIVVGIFLIGR
jgi:drug/metabolite transporter (DMT)-like permease